MDTLRPPSDRLQCWSQALRERSRDLVKQSQQLRKISGSLLREGEARRNGKQKDGKPAGFPTRSSEVRLTAAARVSVSAPLGVPDHVAPRVEMNELPLARRDVHL